MAVERAIVAAGLILARAASAATVHVTYLVEAPYFHAADPRADRALVFELFAANGCRGAALRREVVTMPRRAAVATVKRRGGRRKSTVPPVLKLETDLVWDAPRPGFYLRVTGRGVRPVGSSCQAQVAEVARCDARRPQSCPPDSVPSGDLCVDRYEASVWEIPASSTELIDKLRAGTATLADLTNGGARQVGFPGPPFGHTAVPGGFRSDAAYTSPLYAVSLPGVLPSTLLSAYQAWTACGFVGKRLPTGAEWSAAAEGTPGGAAADGPDDCNTGMGILPAGAPVQTGSRRACVSASGAFDMVGNVSEWTMENYATTSYRGGAWDAGDEAGITFLQVDPPLTQDNAVGFRCVR